MSCDRVEHCTSLFVNHSILDYKGIDYHVTGMYDLTLNVK